MANASQLEKAADLGIKALRLDQVSSPFPLWITYADTPPCSAAEKLLSKAERARADRFHSEQLRNRYVAAHCTLRVALEHCFGLPAERQVFAAGPLGKPRLEGVAGADFSISYSKDRVLIGVATGMSAGVDIEYFRPIDDSGALASELFSLNEQARLGQYQAGTASFDRMFLEMWARKEACVKAPGIGIAELRLSEIDMGVDDGPMTVRVGDLLLRTDTILVENAFIAAWAAGER